MAPVARLQCWMSRQSLEGKFETTSGLLALPLDGSALFQHNHTRHHHHGAGNRSYRHAAIGVPQGIVTDHTRVLRGASLATRHGNNLQ